MKKLTLVLLSIFCAANGYSQIISLDFPHFASQEWYMTVFRGDGKDTIATGMLDSQGKIKITLPEKYKNHRGMAQWLLVNGGGLDIILSDGRDVSISCGEAQPSEETIVYTDSRENTYVIPRYHRQQYILKKIDAMRMAIEAYTSRALPTLKRIELDENTKDLLYIFNTELQKQEQVYNILQEETTRENLYAARFAQIVDIKRGLPLVFSSGKEDFGKQLKDYVLNDMDMDVLYTSGHWSGVLEQFIGWYTYNEENKDLFISDIIKLLNRIQSDEIYTALAEKVVVYCEKQNLHDQEIELAFFLLNDDRIKEPSGKIASLYTLLKIRKGAKAPALVQGKLPNKKTILAFYDSDCGNCTEQMSQLAELYPKLNKQGFEVVSVSADSNKDIFENYSSKLPWKDKYCDFDGFAGKDFLNYGIIGTPTFYIINKDGIIQGRYARVEDMNLIKEKK